MKNQIWYWYFWLQARVGKTTIAVAITLLFCGAVVGFIALAFRFPMETALFICVACGIFILIVLSGMVKSMLPSDPRKVRNE